MSIKLKALGLALFASLAVGSVSVVSATGSTGTHFMHNDPDHWVTIDGDQVGEAAWNRLEDVSAGSQVTCPNASTTYTSTITETTFTDATVQADYPDTGCSLDGGFGGTATIDMNGCDFTLTAVSSGAEHTQAHLVCPTTTTPSHKQHEVTVTLDPAVAGECIIHIPSQTPTSGGVVFTPTTDNGVASFKVDVTATGVTNNRTEIGFLGCAGDAGEQNDSNLRNTITVTTKDTEGNPVNVEATGAKADFHSEVEHSLLTGSDLSGNGFKFGELFGPVTCEQTQYVGTLGSAQSGSITIEPTYSGCEGLGRKVTTHMHGCGFVLKLTGEGEDGQVEIECPGEKSIETTYDSFEGGCTITIGPQTAGGVVDYKGEGAGSARDLLVTWTLKEIDYVRDGCELEGAAANGTYSGSVTIEAENTSEAETGLWIE